MRTINLALALLVSLLFGAAQALTQPDMKVFRVSTVDPVARIVSQGGEDYHPVATTSITYSVSANNEQPLGLSAVIVDQVSVGISVVVSSQPVSPVPGWGTTTFTITVSNPNMLNWSFRIRVGSTDRNANPYTWTVFSGDPRSEISVSHQFVEIENGSVFNNAVRVGQADPIQALSVFRFVVRNTGVAPLNITNISFPEGAGQRGGVPVLARINQRGSEGFNPPTVTAPWVVDPGWYKPFYVLLASDGFTLNWYVTINIASNDGLVGSSERNFEFGIRSANGTDFNGFEQQTPGRGEIRVAFLDHYSHTDDIVVNTLLNRGVYQVDPTRPQNIYKIERNSKVGVATTYGMLLGNVSMWAPMRIDSEVSVVTAGLVNASAQITKQLDITVPVPKRTDPATIPNVQFDVAVTPLKDGPWAVPLTLRADDSDGEDPYTITLVGYAYGSAFMWVSRAGATPSTVELRNQTLGAIASAPGFVNTHNLVVTNPGVSSAPLLLAGLVPTPTLTNCTLVGTPFWSGTTAPIGSSVTYTIQTTPTSLGPWSCNLSLSSNEEATPFGVTLSGSAVPPIEEMDLYSGSTPIPSGSSYAAMTSLVAQASAYSFRIQNSGTAPLTVTSAVASTLANCAVTVSAPSSVAATDPSTSGTLIVTVTPPAEGAWSCTVTILNSDTNEGTYVMNLSGVARKVEPQEDCALGSGFSLLLLLLAAAIVPLAGRRR